MLDRIAQTSTARPTIFIDIEGVYTRSEGRLCFIAIHHTVSNQSFVVDIHRLGATTFSTPASDGKTTLKTMLESSTTPKGIFDVRNNSAALYHTFGVRLRSMHDVQLLEVVSRRQPRLGSWKMRRDLDSIARSHANIIPVEMNDWSGKKVIGANIFVREKERTYEIFRQRPLDQALIPYSINDVVSLTHLYERFTKMLSEQMRREVESKTEQAILGSLLP
jgi:exonuclease 3'-5' domain-containing protein 1